MRPQPSFPRLQSPGISLGAFLLIPFIWGCLWWIGGTFAIHYDAVFWYTYVKHEPLVLPYLPCIILAIFLGGPAIVIAAVTFLLSFML